MIKEIYTRDTSDPAYEDAMVETSGTLEILLAKIRMILGTDKGEVLGEYNLGLNLEDLVFKTRQNAASIEKTIHEQLAAYVVGYDGYKIYPSVKFGHHRDGYDYAIIDIKVNDVRVQSFLVD